MNGVGEWNIKKCIEFIQERGLDRLRDTGRLFGIPSQKSSNRAASSSKTHLKSYFSISFLRGEVSLSRDLLEEFGCQEDTKMIPIWGGVQGKR